MRLTPRLLALPSSVGTQSSGLKPVPLALLPPIPLYRRLLRAHRRHLPPAMRLLGDEYVKSEFRAHRNVENPVHIIGFLTEWQMYAQQVEGDSWRGEKMEAGKVDKMSDQQIGQLYELMNAIREKELAENDPEYEPPPTSHHPTRQSKFGTEAPSETSSTIERKMCRTTYWKSRTCNHCWIELHTPCASGMDLLTCPAFSADQPYGPAEMPNYPGRWAPGGECPRCDYETYDMRRRRIIVWKKAGVRLGVGPGRRDGLGVDCVSGCSRCAVM